MIGSIGVDRAEAGIADNADDIDVHQAGNLSSRVALYHLADASCGD